MKMYAYVQLLFIITALGALAPSEGVNQEEYRCIHDMV